jgi:hypothetical protein
LSADRGIMSSWKPHQGRALEAALAAAVMLSTVVAWKTVRHPFVVAMVATALSGGTVAVLRRAQTRLIAANVASIALMLLLAELYCCLVPRSAPTRDSPTREAAWALSDVAFPIPDVTQPPWREAPTYSSLRLFASGKWRERHPLFGTRILPERRVRVLLLRKDGIVYDAEYTSDAQGLRTTVLGAREPPPSAPAILLFGCSFTFGQGLPDSDTTASVLQRRIGDRFRVFNLAMDGAGPQTMIAQLEEGLVDQVLGDRKVAFALYGTLRDHIWRARGDVPWADCLPRYEWSDGVLVRNGLFRGHDAIEDGPPRAHSQTLRTWIDYNLRKSSLLDRLTPRAKTPYPGTQLYLDLVERARDVFRRRYRKELVVFSWDTFGDSEATVREGFARRGIHFLTPDALIKDFRPETHYLPGFNHPNSRANREMGESLASYVLQASR